MKGLIIAWKTGANGKVGRSHWSKQVTRGGVFAGGFPLECGRWVPNDMDGAYVEDVGGVPTCQKCAKLFAAEQAATPVQVPVIQAPQVSMLDSLFARLDARKGN